MNRRRSLVMTAAAALFAVLLVYAIGRLQEIRTAREGMTYVVVPKRFIGAGETIAAGDLALRLVPKGVYDGEAIADIQAAAGMEAVIPLGEGEPILSWKVDRFNLFPGPNESTFQIPKDYIRSISNGIRAGDRVVVYLSGEGAASGRLFEETVKVASVKSSSNMEIDNMDDPHLLSLAEGDKERMYASRRDANGMIEYINLNLTEAQWLAIDTACKDGTNQIVIAYSPETMDAAAAAEGEEAP
ncbi:SAF domain-containing protein [Paenibacillus thailandensis]|uniref:SAF domain-containing protein n=1 Tax=Paenibacillus thailandensis TaxID=393250 RepID=A0ABW5QSX5_9BACL